MTIQNTILSNKDFCEEYSKEGISRNRKSNFTVKVNAPEKMEIEYKLKKLDFDFGCNIFMLNQYDTDEENINYLNSWKKLFNTAVMPLYWEGTEPQQGKLRYSSDSKNDIYRRPPADIVVDFCKKNNINIKGHPLFWHEFIPSWLPEKWGDLVPLLEKRLKEISDRYAEIVPVFDAVNEPSRIWDMTFEHSSDGYKMIAPPDGYVEQIFEMCEKYFPNNTLVLNDTVGASFIDFRGTYGGYYQQLKHLIEKGVRIDRIGLQCHTSYDWAFKNVFSAERLISLLNCYGNLGKKLVISEISILSEPSEELQALATEQLYKIAFANKMMSGIFWWNLDDNGILTCKDRTALGENLPSSGLMRNGVAKQSYKVLDNLINNEWTTSGKTIAQNGKVDFNGFYGIYEIKVNGKNVKKTVEANFSENMNREIVIEI